MNKKELVNYLLTNVKTNSIKIMDNVEIDKGAFPDLNLADLKLIYKTLKQQYKNKVVYINDYLYRKSV